MSIAPLRKVFSEDYQSVLARVPDALKAEGFGVLTEIDVKETLKQKINVDFRRYKILGACNPPLAHRALQAEPEVGLLLPCNVIVYEDDGKTIVSAVDPLTLIPHDANAELHTVAITAREKLARAIASLS